ncbi:MULTISPECIES: bifunctional 2-polyprenyl-6-hydroxyphenol methylase/3-demethylubiquinol 3-O-methyltransferase UbiG [unclassified Oceanispirochaeta]|uniref:class I SAM-dependent methyltransferase n=1 Tax=unclassified Oceanispirochaeta TaxID=2635722 RepID=UPI000E08E14D|nr:MULTISPECIES: class I SAM-dependent methyltransferase [unclassified Oceanispirochaeta]MBF9014317.1 class I SAM-dependent methyltransferase [Oceanispirochaeta sp. M2]NPD71203.1 class I SAM-dependent methyltransferase [Oceanispirochaeta sp. M1]RDG33591.1 class I SAM-dependent methyltransferase [Oceanispirochaeta sp. M1]
MDLTMLAYNNSAGDYDSKFSTYSVYKKRIYDFAEILSPGSRILDLGCGSGINAEIMQSQGHSVTGLDSSESMLDLARRRCPEQFFIQGSVNSLGDSLKRYDLNVPFDALCLSFIIVHLNDEECYDLLKILRSLIKDDGLLYLSFMPLAEGKTPGYEKTSFSEDEIYFHYHNTDVLISILIESGFRLESRIVEEYEEKDGSVTADLFLMFRSTGGDPQYVL